MARRKQTIGLALLVAIVVLLFNFTWIFNAKIGNVQRSLNVIEEIPSRKDGLIDFYSGSSNEGLPMTREGKPMEVYPNNPGGQTFVAAKPFKDATYYFRGSECSYLGAANSKITVSCTKTLAVDDLSSKTAE